MLVSKLTIVAVAGQSAPWSEVFSMGGGGALCMVESELVVLDVCLKVNEDPEMLIFWFVVGEQTARASPQAFLQFRTLCQWC